MKQDRQQNSASATPKAKGKDGPSDDSFVAKHAESDVPFSDDSKIEHPQSVKKKEAVNQNEGKDTESTSVASQVAPSSNRNVTGDDNIVRYPHLDLDHEGAVDERHSRREIGDSVPKFKVKSDIFASKSPPPSPGFSSLTQDDKA